jgi:hypothetical protein
MLAMTIALASAGGGKALGWHFPHPAPTLYIDGEQSERDQQTRFKELAGTIQDNDPALMKRNLDIVARAGAKGTGTFLDIANKEHHPALINLIKEQAIALCILDNFSTLSDSIDDENSAGGFKPVQALLVTLKEAACAAILVCSHA